MIQALFFQLFEPRKRYKRLTSQGGLTRNDLCDTICITLIRFMTSFIYLKSLHTNLKK